LADVAHQLFELPRATAISSNLTLIAGAKVEFFITQTTTPTPVYQDSDLSTEHTNPVIADAAGRLPPIYLDPSIIYKIEFRDSADVEIYPAVDPVNDQVLSQETFNAFYFLTDDRKRTAAEIAADVTPTNYAYLPGDVRRYGAVCNGVADDSEALQQALDVGGVVTLFGAVKCATALTMDAANCTLDGRGCTLLSGLTSAGFLLTITSTEASENCTRHGLRNLFIQGDDTVGVIALSFEATTPAVIAGFTVQSVSINNFQAGVRIYENAFCLNFAGCMFSELGSAVYVPTGGTNYGEKITFNHCFFGNNTKCLETAYEACQLHLINCSLDYSNIIASIGRGWALFENCYVENNLDTNEWFEVGDGASRPTIIFRGGVISVAGAKTTALCSAASGGRIYFENTMFFAVNNSVGGRFLGSGFVRMRHCFLNGFSNDDQAWASGSSQQNYCGNGAFTTDLSGWTTGSDSGGEGGLPTRNATAGSSGGPALEFLLSAPSEDQWIYYDVPCESGENVGITFSAKAENVNYVISWIAEAHGDGLVIATLASRNGVNVFNGSFPLANTGWNDYRWVYREVPSSAKFVRFKVKAETNTHKCWVENVVIGKY
jgi:hypothetical protein